MDQEPDALEIVARSRWYVLVETADGYGIWPVGRSRTGSPLEAFAEDAEGFAAADRAFRRLNRQLRAYRILPRYLAAVVFISVPIWAAAQIAEQAWLYAGDFGGSSFPPTWVSLIGACAYPLWLGALASLLTLFLLRRAGEPEIDA